MILSTQFIDIDELCVEANQREEFQISNFVVDCDFVFCNLRGTVDSQRALLHSQVEANIRDNPKDLQK